MQQTAHTNQLVHPENQFVDCSQEETAQLHAADPARCWLAADIRESDWLIPIDPAALAEIENLAMFIERNPVQNYQRQVADFEIPAVRKMMAQLKHTLDEGVGFAVLDRLDVDRWQPGILVEIYWLLGQLVGRPVAQKWNGQMVYDVRDTGQAYAYGVRGSYTTVELVFHTDNAFGMAMPEYVGLLCRNTAKSGGISRFCSLYTLHQRIAEQHPDALARLYRPMLFDRQKEHHEDAPPLCLAPFFSVVSNRLRSRANTSLVRKAYALIDQPMDRELEHALEVVEDLSASVDLWYEAPLQRGQIQYLNNRSTAHYRSEFVDYDEPERKRHLVRIWNREAGSNCYDGI